VFSRHRRKAKVLFGLSDILVTALAFEAAYQSRIWLPFEQVFYLILPVKVLLLGFSVLVWILIGFWLNLYERLDSGNPLKVVRDSFKQTALGTLSLAAFQYLLRLEFPLSRSFLALFALYSWGLLCAFRLAATNLAGVTGRGFGTPHNVLVVGTGASARRLGEALEGKRQANCILTGVAIGATGSGRPRLRG
jgi:FlaA1/EpsC-like NDP-sugar epimerase